jgi:hypothetical protein
MLSRRHYDPAHATSQSWWKKRKSSAYNSEVFHSSLPCLQPSAVTTQSEVLIQLEDIISLDGEKRRKRMEIGEEEKLLVFLFTTDVR